MATNTAGDATISVYTCELRVPASESDKKEAFQFLLMGQDRGMWTSEGLHQLFKMPSLISVPSHPRHVLQISNNGMVWGHIVHGIWPLGSEPGDSFCEGYRLFLALFVPASSLSHGVRQGNEPLLPPAACTTLFAMVGS